MKEPMKNPGIELARELTMIRLSHLDDVLRMDQERRQNEMRSGALIYCGEQPTTAGFIKRKPTNQIKTYVDLRKKYEATYMLLNGNEGDDYKFNCDFPWTSPNDLRKLGWSVAVHNDYKLNGENYTFWLMTKNNVALKGEGKTDEEALNQIREQILKGTL